MDEESSKYPWEKWLDGRVWFLRTHTDFTCMEVSIQGQAHLWASKLKLSVSTRVVSDGTLTGVIVQAFPRHSTWKPNLAEFPLVKVRNRVYADNPR